MSEQNLEPLEPEPEPALITAAIITLRRYISQFRKEKESRFAFHFKCKSGF